MRAGVDLKVWRFMAVSFLIHLFLILAFKGIPLSIDRGERDEKDVVISIEIFDDHIKRHSIVSKKRIKLHKLSAEQGLKKETAGNPVREVSIEKGENPDPMEVKDGSRRGFDVYSFDNGYRGDLLNSVEDNRDTSYDGGSIEGGSRNSNGRYLLEEIRRMILNAIIYPEASRKKGHEGRVRLSFHIDGNGRITEYRIISSSGWDELDRSVIDALLSIKVYPAYDGWIILPVEFRLR